MKTILSKNELLTMMPKLVKSSRNGWIKSKVFSNLFFWSADDNEFGMFPTFYATLKDLENASDELYGIKGKVK